MFLAATLTLSKAPDIVWSILPSVMISPNAEFMGTALMTLRPKSSPTYSVSFPTVNIELNSLAKVELEAVCAAPNYPLGVFSVRRVSCLKLSFQLQTSLDIIASISPYISLSLSLSKNTHSGAVDGFRDEIPFLFSSIVGQSRSQAPDVINFSPNKSYPLSKYLGRG